MNKRIIQFLEDIMSKKDISCASLAQLTGIAYRRLLMVFVWILLFVIMVIGLQWLFMKGN